MMDNDGNRRELTFNHRVLGSSPSAFIESG
jgi:hypothetical protein